MRTFVLALLVAVGLGGGVAFAQYADPSAAPAAAPAASPAAAAVTVVHIKNFAFSPDSVTISAGQTVRFVQDDETPHTVTASDTSFDSGNLDKGGSWVHAFPKAGTFAYICTYHPYMKGTVIVK